MDYILYGLGYYTYEQEDKAIKIQKNIRKFLAKKKIEKIKSAIIIQSFIRSKLTREHIKRTNAANKIAACYLEYYFRTKWLPRRLFIQNKYI
tara:strand:+ start:1646 stop:1921 length:276 start_codon:yes stop_codon:yes gene_type:complete